MIIRKITKEEYLDATKTYHLAFAVKMTYEVNIEELEKKDPKLLARHLEKWAAFDENNNMMAITGTIPFTVRFDGNEVLMSGISGVSTLPEYRRKGVMGSIIKAYLNDQYHNDYAFSYLYPFSTAYYNKFGYEKCCENIRWEVNIKALKPFDVDYTAYMNEAGSHTKDFSIVYNKFMENYNMSVVRNNSHFARLEKNNPAKDGLYTYVFKDKENKPIAALSFSKEVRNNKRIMACKDLYFINIDGLKAILNHIYTYRTYYQFVEFFLPIDIRIAEFLYEWALEYSPRHLQFKGMARVVNVEKILNLANYKGEGKLIIKINDDIIPLNNNTYQIAFKNNKLNNLIKTNDKPDIELEIGDFSRLIVGTHDFEEFKYLPKVKINNNFENIKKVFYKKKNMIYDSF